MWRQVFVICLLITLSDFLNGVDARQEETFDFEKAIDNKWSRRNFEKNRQNDHIVGNSAPILRDQIAKDVQNPDGAPPPLPYQDPTATKQNITGTTKSHNEHGTPQPLSSEHHRTPTDRGSIFAKTDIIFMVTIAACSVAGLVGIIMAGVCWYKLNRSAKAASDVEYPAYGVTGPNKERIPSPGDRKLAQSAQMYHYQHQKQQMIAMEKANGEMKHDASDEESEEENEEGDYTVYECPGLAPTGEMEVKNPLFTDETPVTPGTGDDKKDGSH